MTPTRTVELAALARGAAQRVAALERLQLLDSPPEPATDRLVHAAARALDASFAALTLVDAERAWTKASTRRDGTSPVPAGSSVAAAALASDDGVAVVEVEHQAAGGPGGGPSADPTPGGTVAAAVVRSPGGVPVGALEVGWDAGVRPTDEQLEQLRSFASLADGVLELCADVEEYRRFVELSPDAVAVLDAEGVIVRVNPAFERLVAAGGREQLTGQPLTALVARTDRARVTAQLARVIFARNRSVRLDVQMLRSGGEVVPCSLSVGQLGGARQHLQVVVHDLTERQRAEESRTRLSEQLARAQQLDALGQVAGGLAHDLNNLLVVMVSNLALANETLDELGSGSPQEAAASLRADLAELELAVDRASRMTSELLGFAHQEHDGPALADVAEAVDAARRLVGRTLGPEVRLEVELPAELPEVAADEVQLERVLVNLLINAREALVDGSGTIRVVAGPTTGPAPDRRPSVRIAVSDDGHGMDEEVRARAFEPLFTTRGGEGGTGLGLASALAFAEEVDGEVQLESQVGVGTTVSLILPVAQDVEAAVPVGVDVPVAGARVVLVDPGERTRRVIAAMLQGAGYRVRGYASADEAMAALTDPPADLLITELSLPGSSGRQLLQDARRLRPGLSAVLLESVDVPAVDDGQEREVDGAPVLVKPFSHARLLRVVEQALATR